MLTQQVIREALIKALSTGADYAEVYAEHTEQKTISLVSAKVDKIADAVISGVGIRIFKGTRCVAGSASSLDAAAVLSCAARVAEALQGVPEHGDVALRERIFGDIHPIRIVPASVEIATSEGLFATDRQIRTRVNISAIASDGNENQTGSVAPGARKGLELFEEFDPGELGRKAAKQAVTMLHAGYIDAGVMPVAIENGFGGVIFHEACGHSLEASGVALGQSQFCGKLGQQIANPKVTAIDDGTIPNAWGSVNIDDEGTPAQRKVLIDRGILKTRQTHECLLPLKS